MIVFRDDVFLLGEGEMRFLCLEIWTVIIGLGGLKVGLNGK